MTNDRTPDGHPDRRKFLGGVSVRGASVRLILDTGTKPPVGGLDAVRTVDLRPPRRPPSGPINEGIAAVLARPYVTGWVRLHRDESATTLRVDEGRTPLTDGPFIDSKEYLAGLILIDVDNLDAALDIAQELAGRAGRRPAAAIEVRPSVEGLFCGA